MSFQSEKPEPRQHCVTLRVSGEQNELLDHLAAHFAISKGEVVRKALDYWTQNAPEAKRALRSK